MGRPKKQPTREEKKVFKDSLARLVERAELREKIDFTQLQPLKEVEDNLVKWTVMYVKAMNHATGTCNIPDTIEYVSDMLEDSARRMIKSMLLQLSSTYS